MNTEELIKKLESHDPIVIVGPDGTKRTKLRVYAYGGRIGRIGTNIGENEPAGTAYVKYLIDENEKKVLENGLDYLGDKGKIDTYLNVILKAAEKRFTKAKGIRKERCVESEIVKNHMKVEEEWCIVDMEFHMTFSDKERQTVDLVVLDGKEGFGLIELKYNNENCDNLGDHYKAYSKVNSEPECKKDIVNEIKRRMEVCKKYGLIEGKCVEDALDGNLDGKDVWYGFLFVGGGKEEAIEIVNKKNKRQR